MAKRKQQPPDEGSPAWMSTFSDLMNLLLCFFILLFASSTMDEGKIQKIAASFDNLSFSVISEGSVSLLTGEMLSGGMTQLADTDSVLSEAGKNIDGNTGDKSSSASPTDAEHLSDNDLQAEVERRGEQQSEEMYEEVMQMAETYAIDDQIILDFNDQYVELDLNGSILFDSGNAEIKDNSKLFLQKIAQILVKYKYNVIEIEGHTDNIPISNSKYEDNRSLSSERARSVYEYVVSQEHFIDSNIKIAGYGDSRPVASNETEISIINLVFNILLVFVFMPSTSKTNKLITDIAEVLDIEIASQTKDDSTFDVSNLAHYQLEQGNPINLKNDGSGDLHVVQYGLTINMDKTASDYSKVSANIEASTAMIYDMARNIIGSYTYTEVIDGETTTNKIKEELLKQLKETFNTECIYSVSFYNWVAQ